MTFPHEPSWRYGPHSQTSRAAALSVKVRAPGVMIVLAELLKEESASPEQLQAKLAERGRRVLLTSIRARVCQLHKLGRVVDSGARSLGESGHREVIVWRLTTAEELASFQARILVSKRARADDV